MMKKKIRLWVRILMLTTLALLLLAACAPTDEGANAPVTSSIPSQPTATPSPLPIPQTPSPVTTPIAMPTSTPIEIVTPVPTDDTVDDAFSSDAMYKDDEYTDFITQFNEDSDDDLKIMYEYAKNDYKDSRFWLEYACIDEWIIEKLVFSDRQLVWDQSEYIYSEKGEHIGFKDHFYATFTVTNDCVVPIEGSFEVTMIVAGGGDSGPVKTVVMTIEEPLQPGETRAFQTNTWTYDCYGDYGVARDWVKFGTIDRQDGLRVAYD